MIAEIQELKRSGYSFPEACSELRRRHAKVPCEKTVRKCYSMDRAPDDNHAKVRRGMAFDAEPFRDAAIGIVASNPGCCMGSVYDVLVEAFVESGRYPALPGNGQTPRDFIRRLERSGAVGQAPDRRRRHDVMDAPPPGEKAQVDFGRYGCGKGLTVHFTRVVLWHSRLPGVHAQDRRFDAEEACRAPRRFPCRCGGRAKTPVVDRVLMSIYFLPIAPTTGYRSHQRARAGRTNVLSPFSVPSPPSSSSRRAGPSACRTCPLS